MTIAFASDHGGYEMKQNLIARLEKEGHTCRDFGTNSLESCDYPDFCAPAARAVASGECERGIVICTTGIGVSIACNKVKGIRCAHCADDCEAELTRRHNNANMVSIGAGFTGPMMADRIVDIFLNTPFDGGRHQRRVDKVMALENEG
ncbi:MAG: ribose 5-phosphate isomerase B [Oscillibacter sp.]|nr:ribose 5-phosphate isomerase B [Oscillibacter sp.]